MKKKILITGGAGFIGSHLTDELLDKGYEVRILDNLLEQVHGPNAGRPGYLNREAEFVRGDIRDKEKVREALKGIDAVFHFAARVGVGQSMYEINQYMEVNDVGTSVLLEELLEQPVERLVTASSMSIYGEGLYRNENGEPVHNAQRSSVDLRNGDWNPKDTSGKDLIPLPTPETKNPSLASVYALSKYDQERLTMICGQAYDLPVTALRFFNVYGSRQALSNPYTGVLAIFSSRLMNDKPPLIFEDGLQKRDFIHVHDVARGCRLALESPEAAGEVFNIGSGQAYTIREIAEKTAEAMNRTSLQPEISGNYRTGDIRHCFADLSKAKAVLGFSPEIPLEVGMNELLDWLASQSATDRVDQARDELRRKGLTIAPVRATLEDSASFQEKAG